MILLSRVRSRPDGRPGAAHSSSSGASFADVGRLLAVVPEGRAQVTDQQVGFFQGGRRDAKERRARYLARVRSQGRRLRTAADILAEPRDDPDLPTVEELDAIADNDLWIAAYATANGLPLATLNRRHFEPLMIFGLTLL